MPGGAATGFPSSFRGIPSPQTPAAWLRREKLRWRRRLGSQEWETEAGSPCSLGPAEPDLGAVAEGVGGCWQVGSQNLSGGRQRAGVSGPAPLCGVQLCPPAPRSPGRLLRVSNHLLPVGSALHLIQGRRGRSSPGCLGTPASAAGIGTKPQRGRRGRHRSGSR